MIESLDDPVEAREDSANHSGDGPEGRPPPVGLRRLIDLIGPKALQLRELLLLAGDLRLHARDLALDVVAVMPTRGTEEERKHVARFRPVLHCYLGMSAGALDFTSIV